MKTYAQRYEDFTKSAIKLAEEIHAANKDKVASAKYTLPQITQALRNIYKNPTFHSQFVGGDLSDNKWSSGFCAMASVIIYELYGGADVWDLMAIRYNDWQQIASVVFLRDKQTGKNFGTVGEYFHPLKIPYEIGVPLDTSKLKTPNKEKFKQILISEMERR